MLKAKVADTPHALQQGLMFVEDLPEDEGMLFVFPRSHNLSFWGKNTLIPLDLAFVDNHNVIKKIAFIKPHSIIPVICEEKCVLAIEANAGYFKNNDIDVNDKVEIERASFKDDAVITFRKTKDSASQSQKIKQSQTVPVTSLPQVGAPNVGQPIQATEPQVEQPETQDQSLPVLGPDDIGQYLEDAMDKEEQQVQDGLDGEVDQDDANKPDEPTQEKYPVFSNVFEAYDWAEKNTEVIRINYTTKHGRALIRDVEPHGSFHSQSTKKEIMVTYDETVGGIRAFIMGNIGNWAFVGRKFKKKFVVKV